MKTLKDKRRYCYETSICKTKNVRSGSCKKIYREEDLKQAIKDLKKCVKNYNIPSDPLLKLDIEDDIDKIMGVWEE